MHFKTSSGICLNLDQSKIFLSGNWLFKQSRAPVTLRNKAFENIAWKGENPS